MADHGHGGWGMIGANGSAMGGPGGLGGDTCLPWQGGGHQASPLEGSAQLLGPQVRGRPQRKAGGQAGLQQQQPWGCGKKQRRRRPRTHARSAHATAAAAAARTARSAAGVV